jgi:hypothetical protein
MHRCPRNRSRPPDRRSTDRHPCIARRRLRAAERVGRAPLQERVEGDRVRVGLRERVDLGRRRVSPLRGPLPPVRADPVLDAERLQRVEARMRVERRAAGRAESFECVARRLAVFAPGAEARTQAPQSQRSTCGQSISGVSGARPSASDGSRVRRTKSAPGTASQSRYATLCQRRDDGEYGLSCSGSAG